MSNPRYRGLRAAALVLAGLLAAPLTHAFVITFSHTDFTTTPTFSNAQTFAFHIDVAGPLAPGVYLNPGLNAVEYSVFGTLAPGTPSGFPAFNLVRSIGGAEFYTQGSSLAFEIAAGANLADGLQVAELTGAGTVFEFNGREVGTGRYHPPVLRLEAGGGGSIRNSNNTGGMNPSTMAVVDVDFGEEYVTLLAYDPQLTIAAPVPLPGALALLGSAFALGAAARPFRRT